MEVGCKLFSHSFDGDNNEQLLVMVLWAVTPCAHVSGYRFEVTDAV